ncbi:MAG: ester cyclase [Acidimicrobiales bacterium]
MKLPEIVQAYVDSFNPAGLEVWVETFGPEGTYSDPGTPAPLARQELREYFAGLFDGFPDATIETVSLDLISPNLSVWRWVLRGTNSGSYRGLPVTGRLVTLAGCEFIEVRGGKIHRVDGYFDRLSMLAQLGIAPGRAGVDR